MTADAVHEGVARPQSRRAILAALGGAVAALVAQALGRPLPARATHAGYVQKEHENPTTSETAIVATTPNGALVETTAFRGESDLGYGVVGVSAAGPDAVGPRNTGVYGVAGPGLNAAPSTGEVGVYGFSESAFAVGTWGDSIEGVGVLGTGFIGVEGFGAVGALGWSETHTGVHGFAGSGDPPPPPARTGVFGFGPSNGIGVRGDAPWPGQALRANGAVVFSRSGRSFVGAGTSAVTKTAIDLSANSLVFALVQANRPGLFVRAVQTNPAGRSFTIYLNTTVPAGTASVPVAWFVLN